MCGHVAGGDAAQVSQNTLEPEIFPKGARMVYSTEEDDIIAYRGVSGMQFNAVLPMMQNLYAHAPFPAMLTDASLHICWCNQAAVRQIPLPGDGNGRYGWPAFLPKEPILQALQNEQSLSVRIQDGAGSLLFLPVMDEDRPVGCQVLGGALEEPSGAAARQTAENLLQVSEKNVKMPLTIIFSTLSLLTREIRADAGTLNYLRLILQNCYRLLRFSEGITDIARLWMAGGKLNPKTGDAARFIRGLCDAAGTLTDGIGIPLTCDVPQEPVVTSFDPVRLRRAFLNLISNACRYTREGNRIHVRVEATAANVIVTVSDRGQGMDQATVAALSAQNQSHMADAKGFSGNGIGLALVKTVVEKHGGTLAIDSRPGEGTSVAFSLPVRKPGSMPDFLAQEGVRYLKDRFSPVYVELSDVCGVPLP